MKLIDVPSKIYIEIPLFSIFVTKIDAQQIRIIWLIYEVYE
jgi:hypothetical protein